MTQHRLVADLHLHSRYSMATSPALDLTSLAAVAVRKGIHLLAAPDFTHPAWREEMRAALEPAGNGVFRPRQPVTPRQPATGDLFAHNTAARTDVFSQPPAPTPLFMLVTEISCIWRQAGRSRRVHVMLMAPSFEAADRISEKLGHYQDLASDGRPMVKLSAEHLYGMALDADDRCVVFPAHVWTPWYGMYGSKSGFDTLEECFGEHSGKVPAVETGLSSDPRMNWSVSDIGERAIVSFSDAHSTGTMGRELTVLDALPDYGSVSSALFQNRVVETIEFHPEHGKYHISGHRKCAVKLTPEETPPDGLCPVCGRPLTLGVLHRVSQLADRALPEPVLKNGLVQDGASNARPFRQLVPLRELVAQSLSAGVATRKVTAACDALIDRFGTELNTLVCVPQDELASIAGERTARAIAAVRQGDVEVNPGFDGVYGTVFARA